MNLWYKNLQNISFIINHWMGNICFDANKSYILCCIYLYLQDYEALLLQ